LGYLIDVYVKVGRIPEVGERQWLAALGAMRCG
jgi:hypothetical protein